jgi:hypothetical protein
MKKYNIIAILILFISSCDTGGFIRNEKQNVHKNNCTLIFNGIKEFEIDDETSYLLPYIQYVNCEKGDYFTFYNRHNNSIYFYDYDSSKFIKKIHYEKEGANGVGDMQGYFYVNDDSIFVYSYWGGTLHFTDSTSTVLSRIRVNEIKNTSNNYDTIYPAPYLQTATPIRKYENKFILCGFVTGETDIETTTNRPVCIVCDIENRTMEYIINYPEQYAKYNWAGGFTYRIPYVDINNETILISFSADHYLTSYSLKTRELKKHYAGSSSIKGIKSYPENKNFPCNEDKAWEWYMYNPSYQNILYDPYKKLYYRIARLPVKEYNPGDNGNKKPTIIIVLDSNMNYLGEVRLPENIRYEVPNCFVSKDGFHIQVLTDNEDMLTFYTYNFLSNEK